MKKQDAENKIKRMKNAELLTLWGEIINKTTQNSGWDPGFAFEYMVLRAFELEGAETKYPYSVHMDGVEIEQIDGFVYLKEFNLPLIIESKDKDAPQNIEPIAKLRNQLMRRPAGAIERCPHRHLPQHPALRAHPPHPQGPLVPVTHASLMARR